MIRRTISLTEEGKAVGTSLIVTVIGTDRPGIVSLLSDRAQGFGANWAGSRMANLAGQFAGMVHFEVPPQNAEPLAQALRGTRIVGTARRHRKESKRRRRRPAAAWSSSN